MSDDNQTMKNNNRSPIILVLLIVAIGGLAPLLLYGLFFGTVANITPERAKELLSQDAGAALLIDVRSADEYNGQHIAGSENWPWRDIANIDSLADVPAEYRGRTIILFCTSGVRSTKAARRLEKLSLQNVFNVRGGLYDWIGSVCGPAGGAYERWETCSGDVVEFPRRDMSQIEQLTAVVSGFGFKGCYTVLSLILIIVLWKSKVSDLAAVKWGLIFFFIGENFCLANYLIFFEGSYLFEYMHGFGMLLSFGFITYALLEGFDYRILKLSSPDQRCAALSLCQECVKYQDVACGLKRMFYIVIPASIVLAFMPLTAPFHFISYNSDIFGTYYHYCHQPIWQAFETRYCPIAAMAMFAFSLIAMLSLGKDGLATAKIFFSAGVGALGFGFFRMILTGVYGQNMLWFVFWEEATELLFILGLCCVLWIFRKGLFARRDSVGTS